MMLDKLASFYKFQAMTAEACTEHDLKSATTILANDIGYHRFAYFSKCTSFRSITNYPDEWANRYEKRRYDAIDPIVNYAMNHHDIEQWSEIYLASVPGQKALMDEARDFDIVNGIVIPLGGSGFAHGALTLASPESGCSTISDLGIMFLRLVATQLHVCYRQAGKPVFSNTPLCDAERFFLSWIANGMLSIDIATALEISRAEMQYNTKKLKKKLGATTWPQAIMNASQY